MAQGLGTILQPDVRTWLETEILPAYLRQRRWFAAKDQAMVAVKIADLAIIPFAAGEIALAEIEVGLPGRSETYHLPLSVIAETSEPSPFAIADLASGTLIDAFGDDRLPLGLLSALRDGHSLPAAHGRVNFLALPGLSRTSLPPHPAIRRLSAEQSNSSLIIDDTIIMKLIRRSMRGINPEVEMVRHLSEHGYRNTPPMLGEVQREDSDGTAGSVLVFQNFIPNQGDAWGYTLKCFEDGSQAVPYAAFAATLGTRLAQLHELLAKPCADEAFAPVEVSEADVQAWSAMAEDQLRLAFAALANLADPPPDAAFVLQNQDAALKLLPSLARAGIGALKTRIHGDFHLGQVLVAGGDAYIIDFEGEPAKPLAVRRAKSSPLRDVAGLLRSLHYAAAAAPSAPANFASEMSDVFMASYREVERAAAPRWVASGAQETALLDLFMLEKSAYEICYEAANRPAWLAIPLGGFAALLRRLLNSQAETLDA